MTEISRYHTVQEGDVFFAPEENMFWCAHQSLEQKAKDSIKMLAEAGERASLPARLLCGCGLKSRSTTKKPKLQKTD